MTVSEDFELENESDFEESEYPTAFGVTLTPQVGGIICGLVGVAGAAYLLITMVLPAQQSYKQLQADQQAKEAQLQQLQSGEAETIIENLALQIEQARAVEPQVLSLFSSEATLDTLLLDIYRFIESSNAKLISYQPQGEAVVVDDGSLGELINGKLKRKSFNLEIEGTFAQTQSFLRDLERLKPLLVLKDFRIEVSEPSSYQVDGRQLVIQEAPLLRTTFVMDALLPVDPVEAEAAAAEGDETASQSSEANAEGEN
ncbi:MAG: pilus assembly protein [Cyanophyceae cyanobacterium]